MSVHVQCSSPVTPARSTLENEDLSGLCRNRKELPAKYLYDKRGCELFGQICELREYYPTRTEQAILSARILEIIEALGPAIVLVELGSGNSAKTCILLDRLVRPVAYVPVDIAAGMLHATAGQLRESFPGLAVRPMCADFLQPLAFGLPREAAKAKRRIVFFPGSTVGNLHPPGVIRLLKRISQFCGPAGGALIGVDLKKDVRVLESAYNDRQGNYGRFQFEPAPAAQSGTGR